jgi:hypothetical protein
MDLTQEQEVKLHKLEQEMLNKKTYDENNRDRILEVSNKTGIPYSLVDTDVVKIGSLLGLIQNISKRDGSNGCSNKKEENLMDVLFGCDANNDDGKPKLNYSKIPPYFTFAPLKVSEIEKLEYHKEKVKHACSMYYTFLGQILQLECGILDRYVSFSVQQPSIDSFVETVKENMEVIFEMLIEEEDDDLWEQLKVLRNSLSCVIPLCEYKKIVSIQVSTLLKRYSIDTVFNSISYIDAKLTLFPNCEQHKDKNGNNDKNNGTLFKLINPIVIRSHTRDPELKAFDMECVKKECLTPIYMFLPIENVFHHFIIGPYNNDAIGYLKPNFYILKCINEGIRMWILDDTLTMFSEVIRRYTLTYCQKLFKTLKTVSLDVSMLAKNIRFLSNSQNFRTYVCNIVSANSMIIPTESDVFDDIPVHPLNIRLAHS